MSLRENLIWAMREVEELPLEDVEMRAFRLEEAVRRIIDAIGRDPVEIGADVNPKTTDTHTVGTESLRWLEGHFNQLHLAGANVDSLFLKTANRLNELSKTSEAASTLALPKKGAVFIFDRPTLEFRA